MPFITGDVLQNRYRIVKLLAQGGFGTLYRAWDTALGRPCVLKENLAVSPDAQRQFLREAKILANLSHPNLPRVTDYFVDQMGGQYLVMDYVEGQDLQQLVEERGGPFPEDRALEWGLQICDALSYLHLQSPPVIHRDVKPANIRITPQGKAVLVDFGIAKVYDPQTKTTLGAQAISPGYSPLEQYGKGRTDARSDIYALGATLYTLVTGQEPVESTQRVINDPLVAPRIINRNLNLRTSAALIRALQMDPTQRFQRMDEFKNALTPPMPVQVAAPTPPSYHMPVQPMSAGRTGTKIPVGWMALVGILLVIIFVLVLRITSLDRPDIQATGLPLAMPSTPFGSATVSAETKIPALASTPSVIIDTQQPTLTPLVYFVQSGDTCSEIAEAFKVSIQEIVSENQNLSVDCDLLFSGQPLLIPQSGGPISTPAFIRSQTPALAVITQTSPMDGMTMIYIPAGSFTMGADESDLEAGEQEAPKHKVSLSAYWIDETEVTNGMYARCVDQGACSPPVNLYSKTHTSYFGDPAFTKHPVIYVGWEDARDYCRWTGRRLPSEAEWEKAARGTDVRIYPWGENPPGLKFANYGGLIGDTTPVGSFPSGRSAYGVLDLAGNVAEWVSDWYDQDYYSNSPFQNPAGPTAGVFRLIRGGSWFTQGNSLRTTFRMWNYPDLRSDTVGFRCAN